MYRAFRGSATEAVPLVVAAETDLSRGRGAELVEAVAEAVDAVPGVNAVVTPQVRPDLLAD